MTSADGALGNPRNAWTPDQRLADMNSLGVDVQVVSTNVGFYQYHRDVATTTAIARDCNDKVHQMTLDYPERLADSGPCRCKTRKPPSPNWNAQSLHWD